MSARDAPTGSVENFAEEHVAAFNRAVAAGDFSGFLARFDDDAVMRFENVPGVGVLELAGRAGMAGEGGIGGRIRAFRRRRGLSQERLAHLAGRRRRRAIPELRPPAERLGVTA